MGEVGGVRGEEEEPAKTGPLTQLQDRADILDSLQANILSFICLDLRINTIDSGKIPDSLQKEESALSENDLSFLLK